jgi:hypothetical protein
MNDLDLETPRQPGAVPQQAAQGAQITVPAAVQRHVLAWALEELAPWRLNRLDPTAAAAAFASLNATSRVIYIYRVSRGSVDLLDKPAALEEVANNKRRALVYLAFFRAVAGFLPEGPPFLLALATADKVGECLDVPVFTFQRRRGEESVLLPDIDFLNHDFYGAPRYHDNRTYRSKNAKAVFVGSTSGGRVTPEAARHCTLPRLRAARAFEGNPRVDFLLPQIVQTTSEEAADILRQMAFCQASYMPWQEQLSRRFVISMDGNGATCSRVAIALKSNSVLLKYKSEDLLYYFRHLQPWLHYVPVDRDSDIDAILDMEQASPGLFESIAENGRQFAAAYLSRDAVFAYAVELFTTYAQCFTNAVATEIHAGASAPGVSPMPAVSPGVVFVAHVQGRGDVTAGRDGWIGGADNRRLIEGFTFSFGISYLNRQFSYRTLAKDGTAQEATSAGTYCGTRGKAMPIHGFMMACAEATSDVPALVYEGIFLDGFASGPLAQGRACRSPAGAPLVAMRIGVATG